MSERRDQLHRRATQAAEAETQSASSSWYTPQAIISSLRRPQNESSVLEQELSALVSLDSQMTRSFDSLRRRRAYFEYKQTFKGRLRVFIGKALGVYCVVRMVGVCV